MHIAAIQLLLIGFVSLNVLKLMHLFGYGKASKESFMALMVVWVIYWLAVIIRDHSKQKKIISTRLPG